MPYYGDYYRGDYYRGDPGFLSGIGKVLKGVAKAVIPSPIQAAWKVGTSIGSALVRSPGPVPMIQQPTAPPGFQSPYLGPQVAQARGGYFCGPDGTRRGHLNKSTYVTRGGGTSRWPPTLLVHQKGTECVGPRRMNVANPRALRRALRRASGFAKLARRFVRIQSAFKKGKRRKK